MPQTLGFRNAASTPALGGINPIKTGERVTIWAAGATADTVNVMCGNGQLFQGQINIEASADVVDTQRDALCDWTNTGNDRDLSIVGTVATNGYVIKVAGANR